MRICVCSDGAAGALYRLAAAVDQYYYGRPAGPDLGTGAGIQRPDAPPPHQPQREYYLQGYAGTDHRHRRVYERGVGETQACGSGACAAAAVGIMQGLLDNKVQVDLPGGSLIIEWEGVGSPLYMTGDATHIYDGNIHL